MQITVRSKSRLLAARTVIVAGLTLCAIAFAAVGPANAATYSVYSCLGPSAEALPNSSWLTSVNDPNQTLDFAFGTNCGDLSVAASTTRAYVLGDGAEYVFDAPAGTTISGYSLNRAVAIAFPVATPPPSVVSAGVSETSGATTTGFDCVNVTTPCGSLTDAFSRSGLAVSKLSVGVRCSDDTGCGTGSFTQLSTRLMNARVDLEDPTAPVIASVAGSLPGSASAAAVQSIDATVTDVGGGVRMIDLAIDGVFSQTSVAGGSCGQPYTLRAPCPSGLLGKLSVNTAALTNGVHTATLTATDAAGNLSSPHTFTFSVTSGGLSGGGAGGGGTPPSNGSPAVEQPTVRTEKSVISSVNGRTVVVEGTLTTPAGAPVAGAALEVTSLDLGVFDAATRSIGTITTTSTGRFSVRVKPHGAQRISVLFKPYPSSIGTAVTSSIVREDLRLSVKRSKSRVRPGGALTLRGALDGAGAAADGTPVEIDARIGKSWRAVGVVEANSRGSYKWKYRFTRVKQPTRFTFRAIVRRNKSWPWPTETAQSVTVLVAR
ncbi:MAG: hypothetical protein JHC98_00240 [Thermoleophilaceae bacterium]|nr:hypothetical protein [Thermoleophilaceae bacterium]